MVCGTVASLALAPTALGTTTLSATTYNTNQTWTAAGSPYVLNGNITVSSAAKLTIEPGVVVKFNGSLRVITINGGLEAIGTGASPVVFTSLQDDSVAGDTGGDGATSGSAGQWTSINIAGAHKLVRFSHVEVRYGGNGSNNTNYGAISVSGAGVIAYLDHATISNNQRSGVKVALDASVIVAASQITDNANGISVNNGFLRWLPTVKWPATQRMAFGST